MRPSAGARCRPGPAPHPARSSRDGAGADPGSRHPSAAGVPGTRTCDHTPDSRTGWAGDDLPPENPTTPNDRIWLDLTNCAAGTRLPGAAMEAATQLGSRARVRRLQLGTRMEATQ